MRLSVDEVKKLVNIRPFLRVNDINNKWILNDTSVVVNVSACQDDQVIELLHDKQVDYYWFPTTESTLAACLPSIYGALTVLRNAVEDRRRCILHCMGGANRSKVVYHCLVFMLTGQWLVDEYKGYDNAVMYNIAEGHLPPREALEGFICGINAGKNLENLMENVENCTPFPYNKNEKPLNDFQKAILHYLYKLGATPDSKGVTTNVFISSFISTYYNHFSDSLYEHTQTIYDLARPWVNLTPYIDAQGYIGNEAGESGASPRYTIIRLSRFGLDYVLDYDFNPMAYYD